MWQAHRRSFRIANFRTRLLRCVSVLAVASAGVVLGPGFEYGKIVSEDDEIAISWPGTSASAKRRRHSDGEQGNTYGSFSSGTSAPTIGGSNISSGSGSNAAPNAGNSSSNNSGSNNNGNAPDNNARGDTNAGRGPAGRRADDDNSSNGPGNSGQPATLADTFKALFGNNAAPSPKAPATGSVATPASNPGSTKSSLGAPGTEAGAKSTPKAPAKGVRALPIAPASGFDIANQASASHEILGLRLSGKVVEALQGMGFTVPPQPKTAFDVLLLNTPPGMTADQAQAMLRQEMPKERFKPNTYYRNYQTRGATGTAHSVTGAGQRLNCTGARCLPRELIKWSPEVLTACSTGIAVGVLDTGLDVDHPTFTRPITNSFIPEGRQPAPTWHGTAVYALLAGNPAGGTPGLIPNATHYHGSVFYADAAGEVATDTHVLLSALDWMDRANVKIVNMSFAGPRDQLMEEAIAKLSAKGMIFVAAVGNEGPTAEPAYPAAYRQVIAVTAIKSDRRIYPFANRGRHIDMAAPGVDIWSAVPGAREGYYTGTSFAAPFVTAMLATLYREYPTSIKEKLLARLDYDDLGIPGRDSTYGRGLAIAPRTCAPAPAMAEVPAPPPSWGTTSIEKASVRPPSSPTVSAGYR